MESIPESSSAPSSVPNQLPEERLEEDDDPNEEPEDEEEDQPQIEFEPTQEQLKDLRIAHDNSGHPTNSDFARLLKRGNARPEVVRWVRKHSVSYTHLTLPTKA